MNLSFLSIEWIDLTRKVQNVQLKWNFSRMPESMFWSGRRKKSLDVISDAKSDRWSLAAQAPLVFRQ